MENYHVIKNNTSNETAIIFSNKNIENSILATENNVNFKKSMFDKYPNPTTVIEGISEIELIEQSLHNETQKYIQRTTDGVNAYAKISAEFRLAKLSGTIDDATHTYLENLLIPVRNEVLAGQWISAKQKLINIGVAQVGEVLYNRLFEQLTEYIEINY
jgi:hypothetical protein